MHRTSRGFLGSEMTTTMPVLIRELERSLATDRGHKTVGRGDYQCRHILLSGIM